MLAPPTMDGDWKPRVDLYWLPLGAGGWFVRLNGRLFETVVARHEKRPRNDLYHTALVVAVAGGEFVLEQAWPIRDANGAARGVVAEGPVGGRWCGSLRVFRYEVRRWRDGMISDIAEAVASPQRLTDHAVIAQRVLDLASEVPTPVWGRDELRTGEMWNSHSVISWLIARSGLDVDAGASAAWGTRTGLARGCRGRAPREQPQQGFLRRLFGGR